MDPTHANYYSPFLFPTHPNPSVSLAFSETYTCTHTLSHAKLKMESMRDNSKYLKTSVRASDAQ